MHRSVTLRRTIPSCHHCTSAARLLSPTRGTGAPAASSRSPERCPGPSRSACWSSRVRRAPRSRADVTRGRCAGCAACSAVAIRRGNPSCADTSANASRSLVPNACLPSTYRPTQASSRPSLAHHHPAIVGRRGLVDHPHHRVLGGEVLRPVHARSDRLDPAIALPSRHPIEVDDPAHRRRRGGPVTDDTGHGPSQRRHRCCHPGIRVKPSALPRGHCSLQCLDGERDDTFRIGQQRRLPRRVRPASRVPSSVRR